MKISRIPLLAMAASLLLLAGGCVERVVERGPAPVVYVKVPPPAEIVEVQPPLPGPNWVWQRGHWRWNGEKYYWVRGHWMAPPPRVHVWIAPRWEQRPGGWFFIEGRWQ